MQLRYIYQCKRDTLAKQEISNVWQSFVKSHDKTREIRLRKSNCMSLYEIILLYTYVCIDTLIAVNIILLSTFYINSLCQNKVARFFRVTQKNSP